MIDIATKQSKNFIPIMQGLLIGCFLSFPQRLEVWFHGCCQEIRMRARPWSRSGAIHGSTITIEAHAPAYHEPGMRSRYREAPAKQGRMKLLPSLPRSQHQYRIPAVPVRWACATSEPIACGYHQLDMCNRYRGHWSRINTSQFQAPKSDNISTICQCFPSDVQVQKAPVKEQSN